MLHPCIVWSEADIFYEEGGLERALAYDYVSAQGILPDQGGIPLLNELYLNPVILPVSIKVMGQ